MKTVTEVSRLTGVSVRTLHHYDAMGLLKPTQVTAAGYRLYDHGALSRLQIILLFRELRFPLKEIKAILDRPNFDSGAALRQQIELLELERDRLDKLIAFARELETKGADFMDFKVFDQRELDRYKEEARERWGSTDGWKAFADREKKGQDFDQAGEALMALLAKFAPLKELDPAHSKVQDMVQALQDFISANFYPCTKEILSGLGQMYTGDPRFQTNIDQTGGPGTARFISRAIEIFCKK